METLHMREMPEGARCEVHAWPSDGMARRLVAAMRARHGKGGVTVCRECIARARADAIVQFVGGGCPTGKIAYASPSEAWRACAGFKREKGRAMRAYRCQACGEMHITSVPRAAHERMRRRHSSSSGDAK